MKNSSAFTMVFAFFLVFAFTLRAQEEGQGGTLPPLDSVISSEYGLDTLSESVRSGRVAGIPKDKYLIIEGVVSSRQVIQEGEEDFFGILEISSGAWENGEELKMYRCYFQLRGPEFVGTIPPPRSRSTSPNEIALHSHLIAIGRYLGYGEDAEGNRFPVLEAVQIKKLRM